MSEPHERAYEFGPFRLDARRRTLTRDGRPVAVTSKVFDTLLVLVERRGRVVAKSELMDALWPDTAVEENNLTQHISTLRKILGERAGDHRYVVTRPGRGYSFVAEVRETGGRGDDARAAPAEVVAPGEADAHAAHAAGQTSTRRVALGATALLGALLLLPASVYYLRPAPRQPAPRAESRHRPPRGTESVAAFESYLRGRHFWNKRNEQGLTKSLEHFQRAIDLDPAYAQAYAGLADAYNVLANYHFGPLPAEECARRAKWAAARALEIDDTLAEAHASLALINSYLEADAEAAERAYRRSIELNPDYATAHHWYSDFLAFRGRHEEALAEILRAAELDPLSPIISTTLAERLYYARRYEEAVGQLRRTLDLEPDFIQARFFLGLAYEQQGLYAEAIRELARARELSAGKTAPIVAALGHAYAASGRRREARRVLDELMSREGVAPYEVAIIFSSLGERSHAFEWLHKAHGKPQGRAMLRTLLRADPRLDRLRSDPQFRNLLDA